MVNSNWSINVWRNVSNLNSDEGGLLVKPGRRSWQWRTGAVFRQIPHFTSLIGVTHQILLPPTFHHHHSWSSSKLPSLIITLGHHQNFHCCQNSHHWWSWSKLSLSWLHLERSEYLPLQLLRVQSTKEWDIQVHRTALSKCQRNTNFKSPDESEIPEMAL